MSQPRLDTSEFGPSFHDEEDDEDDGLFDRFDTESDYRNLAIRLVKPTPTFQRSSCTTR